MADRETREVKLVPSSSLVPALVLQAWTEVTGFPDGGTRLPDPG